MYRWLYRVRVCVGGDEDRNPLIHAPMSAWALSYPHRPLTPSSSFVGSITLIQSTSITRILGGLTGRYD